VAVQRLFLIQASFLSIKTISTMIQEFNAESKVHINRDDGGISRDLMHLDEPYVSNSRTPLMAASEYLHKFAPLLGLREDELNNLGLSPEQRPSDAHEEYRFLEEKHQFDSSTVVFSQTYFGLPVYGAGIAVHVRLNPMQIVSARSTRHADLHPGKPKDMAMHRVDRLETETLGKLLGLTKQSKGFDLGSLKIEKKKMVIYEYKEDKRTSAHETHGHDHDQKEFDLKLPLPSVPDDIRDGNHYLAAEITFVLGSPQIPDLHWIAIVEEATLAILYLRALVDTVDGLVFLEEPITDLGGPLPNATNANLNLARSAVLLRGLSAPVAGNYSLSGDIIQLQDSEPPVVAPPVEPVGTDFDFDSRTDNFAAVNAYYHCDRFFQLVKDLGFDLQTYFGGTPFPTMVDHRGMGVTVNAHCLGNGAFGILRTTFALADLTNIINPIGIACDYRVVLHELGGHGILYNHVNFPNFGFAHSAGDSFGAVLCDAESEAPDRFVTFPWVNIGRRHDRKVGAGWAWGGVNDLGGYNSEQILCTTHFRLYQAMGGDSTEVAMRKFAGRYVAYFILRTVGTLTPATNPANATAYASDMMSVSLNNWTSENQTGALYWKVIRWAFEKQGLFQPPGTPLPITTEGAPPMVDVYIENGRHGEYRYGPAGQFPYLQKFWETTDIWNRIHPDGNAEHQTPLMRHVNHAYVKIKNRGTKTANGIVVRGYHCRPSAGLVWPDDLRPMKTLTFTIPGSIPPGGQVIAGPFEWKPNFSGHECMFMSVSAIGDKANNDILTLLPSALGPSPLWQLVPSDNNLGLRAVIPVPGGGRRRALVKAFRKRRFWAKNPLDKTAKIEVRAILPVFLSSRGWTIHLHNPGTGSFTLGAYDSKVIKPRLKGGQSFTAAELIASGKTSIEFVVLANGLVVGGLTYVLDPGLKEPAVEFEHEEKEEKLADEVEGLEEEVEEIEEELEEHDHKHGHRKHRGIKFEIDLD
jgi:zinc metalloprotease ZmpB